MSKRLLLLPVAVLALLVAVPPAPTAAQDISVELVLATDVQDREPVGEATSFPADVGQIYAWMRVTGATGQAIEVVWTYGETTFTVPLEIGGSPWRTWSSKTIPPAWTGEWRVEVKDRNGTVVASRDFTVG